MTGRSAALPRLEERVPLSAVTGCLAAEWGAGGGAHGGHRLVLPGPPARERRAARLDGSADGSLLDLFRNT